jgi:hypothetical protein
MARKRESTRPQPWLQGPLSLLSPFARDSMRRASAELSPFAQFRKFCSSIRATRATASRRAPLEQPHPTRLFAPAAPRKRSELGMCADLNSIHSPVDVLFRMNGIPAIHPWGKTYEVPICFTSSRSRSDNRNSSVRRQHLLLRFHKRAVEPRKLRANKRHLPYEIHNAGHRTIHLGAIEHGRSILGFRRSPDRHRRRCRAGKNLQQPDAQPRSRAY